MPTLVFVSDTHGRHERLAIPACDILVHAGDYTGRGTRAETEAFLRWFSVQPATHKVFVSGNHDFFSEREPESMRALVERSGAIHLVDETVELCGLTIHGSPVVPRFRDMAWNRDRGAGMARHYERIPAGLDLLITHGPPHGTLDRTFLGMNVGCETLRAVVAEKRPRVHVFGHIHEAGGIVDIGRMRSINASSFGLLLGGRAPHVEILAPR